MIPLKPVKRIFGQHCPHQITTEALVELKNSLEEIAAYLAMEAGREFEELNKHREKLGLRRLKRLNGWAVEKASEKVLKRLRFNGMGLQSNGVVSPGGGKMNEKDTAKTRKKESSETEVDNGL